jgi:hypothetical protein
MLTLASCGLTAACTSHPGPAGGSASASCRPVAGGSVSWPAGVPSTLPAPPDARLDSVQQLPSGFTLVTLTTPGTVRDNLLRYTAALQAAGYTAGRGIVGVSQSRLPFTRNGQPGVLQLTAVDACTTRWQVQV